MLMQKEQVSGSSPCGHFPVVGSTRMSASRCFIVSGLSFGFSAGSAGAAAAAGFAAGFFAGFAATGFFVAFFAGAFAFFAAFLFAIYSPGFPARGRRHARARLGNGTSSDARISSDADFPLWERQPMRSRTRARNFEIGIGLGK